MSTRGELWIPRNGLETRRSRADRDPGGGGPGPGDVRFPGDPGLGNFYYGGRADQLTWSNNNTAFTNWNSRMQPEAAGRGCTIQRIFDTTSNVSGGLNSGPKSEIANAYAAGRMPHISFKLPAGVSATDAANGTGQFSTWMNNLAAYFTSLAPKPIWWTFHHEPENDATWGSAEAPSDTTNHENYRKACRNIKNGLDSRGVTNTYFWTTAYMTPSTFSKPSALAADGSGARDWRYYYPDWKGTTTAFAGGGASSKNNPNPVDFYIYGEDPEAVVQGIGLDVYNWWDEEGKLKNRFTTFWNLFRHAYERTGFLGRPYNIMEFGVMVYHEGDWDTGTDTNWDYQLTRDHISTMFDLMPQYDIVACQVFNYAITRPHWRLELADDTQVRYESYGLGVARSNHAQPNFS